MASFGKKDVIQDSDECHEMHCEQCHEYGEEADAVAFCTVCLDFMCEACRKYHKRQNPQHNVQDKASMPQEFCFELCSIHQKFIRFYCTKCETFACSECRKTSHKTCSDINHVSQMAIAIEKSKELKDILKEINFLSDKLERSKHKLDDEIKDIGVKENHAIKVIEQSNQSRKAHFKQQQQACIDAFENYRKDLISVLQEEHQARVGHMIKEQRALDVKLTSIEDKRRKQLEKTFREDTASRKSLMTRNASLLNDIKKNESYLKQNQENKQRCKLLFAMKKASSDLKTHRQEMQKLTYEADRVIMNTLPDQIIAESWKYQSFISSRAVPSGSYGTVENPSDVTRQVQLQRCTNSLCGQIGHGKFCQECGHKMVEGNKYAISLLCNGKLDDGKKCNSELIPAQIFCMKCGGQVDKTIKQLLDDLLLIQNVSKTGHSLDEKKQVPLALSKVDDVNMSRLILVTDDEIPKIRLLRNSKELMSSIDKALKACSAKLIYSFDERNVVISFDSTINKKVNFETVSTWLKKAEDIFQIFLRKLVVKNVYVPSNEWNTVREKLEEINVSNPETVAVLIESKSHTIKIVGEKELVESVFQTIAPIVSF